MESTAEFFRFKYLPPELRHEVWSHALSEWTVWATTHPRSNLALNPVVTMAPFGHAAYKVGQACSEARAAMRETYVCLQLNKDNEAAGGPFLYWLRPDRTILYFGCSVRAMEFILNLSALNLEHFVVRTSRHWAAVPLFLVQLSHECPDIKTLVLQGVHGSNFWHGPINSCCCESPSSHLADLYKTVITFKKEIELPHDEPGHMWRVRGMFSENIAESWAHEESSDAQGGGRESEPEPCRRDSRPAIHSLPAHFTSLVDLLESSAG